MGSDKRKQRCDKKVIKCECSAMVNYNLIGVDNLKVNICPKCDYKDSSVLVHRGDIVFQSTSVWFPFCVTSGGGSIHSLMITGEGYYVENTVLREGLFTLLLIEKPGLYDSAHFVFFNPNFPNDPVTIDFAEIPGENLSIESCNSNDCKCKDASFSSFNSPPKFDNLKEGRLTVFNKEGKLTIVNQDEGVE